MIDVNPTCTGTVCRVVPSVGVVKRAVLHCSVILTGSVLVNLESEVFSVTGMLYILEYSSVT